MKRNPYVWNTIAGVINALQAVVLGMVITRTNGLADAGVLALAFSFGNLFMNIGHFGARKFQVTDVKNEYAFSDYFLCRVITVVLMLVVAGTYLLTVGRTRNYTIEKTITIFMMCVVYATEAMEDVFAGLYQKKDRLDLSGKIFIVRWVAVLGVYSLILYFCKDLVLASIWGAVASVLALMLTLLITFRKFHERLTNKISRHSFGILKSCLPLFLSAFLAYYVTSSPKYAIDKYLASDVQACFGFVSMPVFVIELLNSFLYMPIIVPMAKEWETKELHKFEKRIRKQCFIILGISIVCLAGGYLLGIPVLSFLYGTDLSEYRMILMILLVAGMFMAFAAFYTIVLTIMRVQKYTTVGYSVAAILALLFSGIITKRFGLVGVCIFYVGIMMVIAIIFYIMSKVFINKAKQ